MTSLSEMISGNVLVEAPVVFNPLTAKLAEAAGFPAVYLGAGTMGYIQCAPEGHLLAGVGEGIQQRWVRSIELQGASSDQN